MLGFVTAQRLRDAASFAFAYDDLGRLKTRDAPGAQPDVTYSYDNFGRTVSAAQTGHTLSYAYDQLSRLLSETQPMGTVSSQYDAAGRRTRLTYPGGYYLDYDYDLTGAVTAIRENGATSGVGVLATFAYDDRGRRASLTRGNGLATSYAFDNADRLTSLVQNPAGTADDLTETFSFNPASQIATRTWSNAAYEWNPAAAFLDAYGRNGLNQVTTIPGATLAHDARGNITFDGAKTFAYDADNRLITATQSGQATVNQTYDPAGRLYQSAGTATTRFLYDGVNVIGEYDGSNALLRRYAHGPGADEPLVWLEGSGTADRRFLMADVRGSVIAVTNAAGTVTSKNTYDSYGAPASGNVGRFQYTGQMWMAELKLYHFKARAYHPALGRFLQTDPIGYGDGLNLYQYAGSDPINYADPTGLAQVCRSFSFYIDTTTRTGVLRTVSSQFVCYDDGSDFGSAGNDFGGPGGGPDDRSGGDDGGERTPSCLNAPIAYVGNGARFLGETLSYVGGLGITYGAAIALSSTQLGPWGAPLAKVGLDVIGLGVAAGGIGLGLEFGGAALQGLGKSGLRGGYEQSRALLAEELQGAVFQRLGPAGKLLELRSTTGDALQSAQRGLVPEFSDSVSCSQGE